MPHHKSAIKRLRQTDKRRAHNAHFRTRMRSAVKKVRQAVEENDAEKAEGLLKSAEKIIDSTRSKGIIHRRTASRKISRLTRAVQSLKA